MVMPRSWASVLTVAVFPHPAGPVSRRMQACSATQHTWGRGKEEEGTLIVHVAHRLKRLGKHYAKNL